MAADPNVSGPRPDDAPGGPDADPTAASDVPADAPAGPYGAGAASAETTGAGADGPALHALERAARVPGEATLADRVKTFSVAPLPHHALSRAVLWATRRRSSLVTPVVRRFARAYDVDMSDAVEPELGAYETFNAFFTRALRPDARPVPADPEAIASPADGRISGIGRVRDARVLQAKGVDYSLLELLGGDGEATERLADGGFATVYLSPRDYHRLHMPRTGTLLRQTHVPGRLWSVGPHAVRALDGLFARNERVIAQFDTERGRMALVLVGAINVAAIETVWAGLVTPPQRRTVTRVDYTGDERVTIERGAEMGRFNMGSTVIALFEHGCDWSDALEAESPVRVGESLGRVRPG